MCVCVSQGDGMLFSSCLSSATRSQKTRHRENDCVPRCFGLFSIACVTAFSPPTLFVVSFVFLSVFRALTLSLVQVMLVLSYSEG